MTVPALAAADAPTGSGRRRVAGERPAVIAVAPDLRMSGGLSTSDWARPSGLPVGIAAGPHGVAGPYGGLDSLLLQYSKGSD